MTEEDFYNLSEVVLAKLSDDIEKMDKEALLDVEYSDGILNIIIEKTGQTYVINKHSASKKIWYSSPISGADYFAFDQNSEQWLDSKNINLITKIFEELSQFIKI